MMRYSSLCSSYDYGNAEYWNARYLEEADASFDWYQRYSALRPFVRKFVASSSRILMAGCGNALMSEDMVNDGYVDIMNIDISSVVIDILIKSHAHIPQLKWTLDSLMCGTDAPFSASQMIYEVNRLLKPGGIFMLAYNESRREEK